MQELFYIVVLFAFLLVPVIVQSSVEHCAQVILYTLLMSER